MKRPNLRTMTISLVALAFPVALLVSGLVAAYFKSTNPDKVDITQGLAYLGQSLTAGVVTFALLALFAVVGITKIYRRDHNFGEAKLPLILLLSVLVLIVAAAMTNAYTNKVQDQYLIDNGRPTLQQYFDTLDKQKNK